MSLKVKVKSGIHLTVMCHTCACACRVYRWSALGSVIRTSLCVVTVLTVFLLSGDVTEFTTVWTTAMKTTAHTVSLQSHDL